MMRWARMDPMVNAALALERVLTFLEPVGVTDEQSNSRILNAQISVDTAAPRQLRLTLDPFAGVEVQKQPLAAVLRATECDPLAERTLRLFSREGLLPRSFWVGIAPCDGMGVVKGYIASYDPAHRQAMSHHAREAGWLPPRLEATAVSVYERLMTFSALEGIGNSFRGNNWLGTTLYLRATAPWTVCSSAEFCRFAGLSPAPIVERVARTISTQPPFFGWAIQVDGRGALVDIKLECAVREPSSGAAVKACAREIGIDASVFDDVGRALADAALSAARPVSPAIVSLRFIAGELSSMVAYYSLAVRDGQ